MIRSVERLMNIAHKMNKETQRFGAVSLLPLCVDLDGGASLHPAKAADRVAR